MNHVSFSYPVRNKLYLGFLLAAGAAWTLFPGAAAAEPTEPGAPSIEEQVAESEGAPEEIGEIETLILESTRLQETIQETPAIGLVLTGDEARELGYRTLGEVLEYIPGYSPVLAPSTGLFTRTRGVPNASLILVNGTSVINPGWNKNYASYNYDIDLIDRVESFSSPGGVLWGAHAWLGVVNIITKTGAKNPGLAARVRYGSFGLQKYSLSYGGLVGPVDVFLHGSLTLNRGQGLVVREPPLNIAPVTGNTIWDSDRVTANRTSIYNNLSARLRWKQLELFASAPIKEQNFSPFTGELMALYDGSAAEFSQPSRLAYLSFTPSLGPVKLLLKGAFLDSPSMWGARFGGAGVDAPGMVGIDQRSHDFRRATFLAEASHEIGFWGNLKNSAILGAEAVTEFFTNAKITSPVAATCTDPVNPTLESCAQQFAEDATVLTGSFYLFDEIRIGKWMRVSGGTRFNGASEDYYQPTMLFKGDVVFQPWENIFFKVNYDEGMRPPPMMARYVISGWHRPLVNPEPEFSRTVTTQLNGSFAFDKGVVRSIYGAVGYSYNRLSNLVTFIPTTQFQILPFYFTFPDPFQIHSVEGLVRLGLTKKIRLWFSTNHEIRKKVPIQTFSLGPQTFFSFGGQVSFPFGLSLIARNRLVLPYRNRFMYPVPEHLLGSDIGSNQADFEVDTSYDLSLGGRFLWRGLSVQLMVYNITNNRITDIDQTEFMYGHANGVVVPREGQSVNLQVEYVF